MNPPLSRGHFESLLPLSLFSLLSPLTENHAHFTHFELATGASPYSTLLHFYIYTNITELNLSKHLPTGCFMKVSPHSFYFIYSIYLVIYLFYFYNIYLFIYSLTTMLWYCSYSI